MTQVIGRMNAAVVVGAVAVGEVVSGTPTLAKSIHCPFNTECVGTKRADEIEGAGQNNLLGKDASTPSTTSAG